MTDDFRGIVLTVVGIGAAVMGWTVNKVVRLAEEVARMKEHIFGPKD